MLSSGGKLRNLLFFINIMLNAESSFSSSYVLSLVLILFSHENILSLEQFVITGLKRTAMLLPLAGNPIDSYFQR
jgi:hypothetical protein